jgi:hypothetical protein
MARYLAGDEATKVELLQAQKYPRPEMLARSRFYGESRRSISALHSGVHTSDEIDARIAVLRAEARHADRWSRSELLANADVLELYIYHQGHRSLQLQRQPTADLVRSDVRVTARPTLFAFENDERRLIFLELGERSDKATMRPLAQLAFEVFCPVLRNLPPRAIQVVDVRRGYVFELDRPGSSIGRDLAMACKTITTEWPRIQPPKGCEEMPQASNRQIPIEWK